jgi:hypothetical protein
MGISEFRVQLAYDPSSPVGVELFLGDDWARKMPYPPPADKVRPPVSGTPALCPNRNGTRAVVPQRHTGYGPEVSRG